MTQLKDEEDPDRQELRFQAEAEGIGTRQQWHDLHEAWLGKERSRLAELEKSAEGLPEDERREFDRRLDRLRASIGERLEEIDAELKSKGE